VFAKNLGKTFFAIAFFTIKRVQDESNFLSEGDRGRRLSLMTEAQLPSFAFIEPGGFKVFSDRFELCSGAREIKIKVATVRRSSHLLRR